MIFVLLERMILKKMNYRYSESEIEQIVESVTILVDSREQKNQHVLSFFDNFKHKSGNIGISYRTRKMDSGDYTFMIPANPKLGFLKDLYFDQKFIVERKQHLNELSGNLTANRQRFQNEFSRSKAEQFHLVIEEGSYDHIFEGRYISKIKPSAYLASLLSFSVKYNIHTHFVSQNNSGEFIYQLVRQYIKNTFSS